MSLYRKVKSREHAFLTTPSHDVQVANRISKRTDQMERRSPFKTDNVV